MTADAVNEQVAAAAKLEAGTEPDQGEEIDEAGVFEQEDVHGVPGLAQTGFAGKV
jgi:hypothetical protein